MQQIVSGIEMLRQVRAVVKRNIADLSDEQLLVIPEGFRNNILWNVGHLVVTQQTLLYRLSGQEMYVGSDLVDRFRKGTSPADWTETPDADRLKALLTELPERLPEDYANGRFANFQEYQTSTGPLLQDIGDGIAFNNFHEGLHLGVIQSMKKLIA
ncbi:MAG TPA: DinB family protein [Rhodothermales bacterium]|nr:DinB family protein [Rhodothermales bacterium]